MQYTEASSAGQGESGESHLGRRELYVPACETLPSRRSLRVRARCWSQVIPEVRYRASLLGSNVRQRAITPGISLTLRCDLRFLYWALPTKEPLPHLNKDIGVMKGYCEAEKDGQDCSHGGTAEGAERSRVLGPLFDSEGKWRLEVRREAVLAARLV